MITVTLICVCKSRIVFFQSNNCQQHINTQFSTGQMTYLLSNQQRKSTTSQNLHQNTHTYTRSVLRAIFPREPGLAGSPLILLLHLFLDCASSWDRPKLSKSFLTKSHQVFFGRPLGLIPSTSRVIQRLTQSLSSFRSTCPNHLNLLQKIWLQHMKAQENLRGSFFSRSCL